MTTPNNVNGHPQTLVAAHLGNKNAEQHGLYAQHGRELEPLAQAVADWLMAAPHVSEYDALAAIEIGKLAVLIDRVDTALADGKVEKAGQPEDSWTCASGSPPGWRSGCGSSG
jgi:hypothetical protein